MTHEEAFLEAIREQPDDDTPRLIYADWLEEHGQSERVEFIRLQCALERLPEGSPQWFELSERAEGLRVAHEQEWLGPRGELLQFHQFRRGFLDDIHLDAEQFLTHADELFRLGPIREVWLEKSRDVIHALADSPRLNRVTTLNLRCNELGPEEIRVLSRSPHLTRLTALNLQTNYLDTEAVAVLRQATFFAQLHSLNLSANSNIGATAVEYLVDRPSHLLLRELDLAATRLGEAGVQALTSARDFYGVLTRLNVRHNGISAAGARTLAHSGGRLEELCLGGNSIGDDGVLALASSAAFSTLIHLDLEKTGVGSEGAAALAQSPHIRGLNDLDLSGNHIRARGAKELANSTGLARLVRLNLTGNEIGDDGAKSLANSPHLTNMRALHLGANGLRAWGVRDLVLSPHLSNLYTLDLHGNNLGDPGAQVIARWLRLAQLAYLNLRNNRIGALGAKELAESSHLRSLRALDLSNNDISADELKWDGLCDCQIVLDQVVIQ